MADIYITGKVISKFSLSRTGKGTSVAKGLIEYESVRKVGRDQWRPERHELPITGYSWLAEGLAQLEPGTAITLGLRLNGTRYEQPGQETKHGVQLVCESVAFPPAYRPAPIRELTP
jgi:hypothetical protein